MKKMDLKTAKQNAVRAIDILKGCCEDIVIAGSIRRKKLKGIKDVELVCRPKYESRLKKEQGLATFLGINETERVNLLEEFFSYPHREFKVEKNGEKYKKIIFFDEFPVDLFIANERNYGLILMIRTGSAEYSHQFMKELNKVGKYKSEKGHLVEVKTGKIIPVTNEKELYRTVGFPYKKPQYRNLEVLV